MDENQENITALLNRAVSGDATARSELSPLVYNQLRIIAAAHMQSERADHTLNATALVHEAFARLLGRAEAGWENRSHFFKVAAESMRRVLIDHARWHNRLKRGGGARARRIDFSSVVDLAARHDLDEVMMLDEAVSRLEAEHPRVARVVMLRFYAGLSIDDTADLLGLAPRTVDHDWAFARAWLFDALSSDDAVP